MPQGMLRALNWFNIVSSISSLVIAFYLAFYVSLSWKLKGLLWALFLASDASLFFYLLCASFFKNSWYKGREVLFGISVGLICLFKCL